ncbi:MAG: PAS domain S-box protein [Candidatus Tectimicrobiota bacterium]
MPPGHVVRRVLVYTLAVVSTIALCLLHLPLGFVADTPSMLSVLLLPIIGSAYMGGLGPGLVATTSAALSTHYVLLESFHTVADATRHPHLQWLVLLVSGTLVSVLTEALHRARRRVAASQHLQLMTLAHLSDAVITTDRAGQITFLNAAAERLTGWQSQEAVGQPLTRVLPQGQVAATPTVPEPETQGLPQEGSRVLPQQTTVRARHGLTRPVESRRLPLTQTDGTVQGALYILHDLSAHQQVEADRRESLAWEERLRLVVEAFPHGVLMADQHGIIRLVNQEIERAFGYTRSELLGFPVEILLPTALRVQHALYHQDFHAQSITRLMGMGRDLYGRHKDGRLFPLEVGLIPLQIEQAPVVLATVVDITVRKRLEEALHEQAHVLELAQVLVLDNDCRILFWGLGAEKFYGFTKAEALGRLSYELLQTGFSTPLPEIKAQLSSTGSWEGELLHRKRDGRVVVIVSLWVLHRDAAGQPSQILETYTDITARKQAEDALRMAQTRLQTALEAGGMGTWSWDLAQGYVWGDEAVYTLFGRTPGELADGQQDIFLRWLYPEDRPRVQAALEATINDGQDCDIEYRIVRPDGAVRWLAACGRMERDSRGQPWRMMGVCVDITARKRAEETLRQAQKMEALGTLAGGIAHDFNNVLGAIIGNTELALELLAPDHPVQRQLAEIDKASTRAVDLVRRILSFGRQQDVTRQIILLQPVVAEALQLLRATLPAMIAIRSHYDPETPAVLADATQIHQIMMNLGTNAAHAMEEHGGVLDVRVETVSVDEVTASLSADLHSGLYVRLVVSDTGHGMDQQTLQRIFEPFFTTKPPGQGTGLGLSVVHGIMQQHDGAITVYSEPGQGTSVHCYFPVTETVATLPVMESGAILSSQGARILYIDDEATLVDLGTALLERLGYQATGCTDPQQALELFRSQPSDFDLVITDLAMPGMSGFELAQALLEVRPDLPVILSSGYLRPEDQARAQHLGIRDIMHKPSTARDIARVLQRVYSDRA